MFEPRGFAVFYAERDLIRPSNLILLFQVGKKKNKPTVAREKKASMHFLISLKASSLGSGLATGLQKQYKTI